MGKTVSAFIGKTAILEPHWYDWLSVPVPLVYQWVKFEALGLSLDRMQVAEICLSYDGFANHSRIACCYLEVDVDVPLANTFVDRNLRSERLKR